MKFQEPADKPGLTIRTIRKWRKKCRRIGIRRIRTSNRYSR